MPRVQLTLRVADPEASIDFYRSIADLAEQGFSVRAKHLLEHDAGELLDLRWEGHVAVRGGEGLAVMGEPAQHADQALAGGLGWLAGVDKRPAVSADGVAAGPKLVNNGEVGRRDVGFCGGGGGNGMDGRDDVLAGLVADRGERQEQAFRICLL